MAFFTELRTVFDSLRDALGDVEAVDVPAVASRLSDDALVALIQQATLLVRAGESVRIAATGAVAARSTRDAGHGGLAQKRGHRSTVSLIQDLTGTTRSEAAKHVRLGEALTSVAMPPAETSLEFPSTPDGSMGAAPCATPSRPWHAVLGDALLTGTLTSAQHDAIYRGLGEPRAAQPDDDRGSGAGASDRAHAVEEEAVEAAAAWETAATQLIEEAAVRTVEELRSAARTIRDLLDPVGAARRFEQRFDGRSFRTWIDRDGIRHGSIQFDDDGDAWVDAITATALRPRRGGPRFVDPTEKSRADDLVADPRTNDQLAYDLILDLLRAGALAEAETVFGTRQAGIRIVTSADAHAEALAGESAVGILEDSGATVPGWLVAQHACSNGTITVIQDAQGNPLDLGREARLYSAKQRLALAIRDGGCRIPGCDRPVSYCEAHHIDRYSEDGRTDIDRGILLCRFHHMNLHHHGWRITRTGKDDFVLHIPDKPQVVLRERLSRRYAFGDLQPPPRRFHPSP